MRIDQWLRLVPLLLMMIVMMMISSGLLKPSGSGGKLIGKQIADFSVPRLDAAQQMFTPAVWSGQVALINVFASWCTPCRAEHPLLMKLAKTGAVPIYGIAWRDKPENIIQMLTVMGNPYQLIAMDAKATLTAKLSLTGVPETFLVDREGKIRYHQIGPVYEHEIERKLLPLIAQLKEEK